MTETDRLMELLLARQNTLESIVMLLWNSHPDRAAIKEMALLVTEVRVSTDLNEAVDDEVIAIRERARQQVIDSVLHERRQD